MEKQVSVLLAISIFAAGGFFINNAYAGTPDFNSFVADDPDNGDTTFSNGDTLTITFSEATNATNGGTMTKGEIDANFTLSGGGSFGGAYTGVWSAGSTILTITVSNAAGGSLTIGTTTISGSGTTNISSAADGDNANLISGGAAATLSGDFGTVASASNDSASDSGCSDCVPPTLGLDENGARQVENGFRCVQGSKEFVANATDWYTPMDLLVFDVGVPAHCTVKVFENWGVDNISYVGFAWGVGSRNMFSLAPIQVDYFRGDKPTNIVDPQNLIDVSSVNEGKTSCMGGSEQKCLTVTVNFTPRQKLDNTAILVQLWDLRPNVSYTRFNHGMQFSGTSLNPDIVSKAMDGRHLVTLTSKADAPNKAVDKNGNAWTYNKGWKKIFVKPDYACSVTTHGFDRYCPEFGQMMVGQQYLARQYFDSSMVESRAGPFVAGPDYPDHPRTYQTLMFKNMVDLAMNDESE